MLAVVVLTSLEHDAAIDVVPGALHPQSLRAGERPDRRPELDRPDRQRIAVTVQQLDIVNERHPCGIRCEVTDVSEQCRRRHGCDELTDDLHGTVSRSTRAVRAAKRP